MFPDSFYKTSILTLKLLQEMVKHVSISAYITEDGNDRRKAVGKFPLYI